MSAARSLRFGLAGVFLLLIPLITVALEGPSRKVLLFYQDQTNATTDGEKNLLRETLTISLQGAEEGVFIVEADFLEGTGSEDEKSIWSRRLGCDSWIFIRLRDASPGLEVEYFLYDTLSLSYITQASFGIPKPDVYDLARTFWLPVAESLAALPPLEPSSYLLLQGVPGSRISGLGQGDLRLDRDGLAQVPLPSPGVYTLRADKAGYLTLTRQILFITSGTEYVLEQQRGSAFSLDLSLLGAQFPGLDLAIFPIPDRLFLKAGFTSFFTGIGNFTSSEENRSGGFFDAYPLLNLSLQAGFFGRAQEGLFRPYLGAGFLVRYYFGIGAPVVEPVIPFGLFPVLGFEYKSRSQNRLFFEMTPIFYYVARRNLFPPGMSFQRFIESQMNGGASLAIAHTWFVDLFSFRIGFRRYL